MFATLVALALVVSPVAGSVDPRGMMPGTLCETEDADDCYWNASESGNGQGRSFYVIDGVVTYL